MASIETLVNQVIDKVKANEELKFEEAKRVQSENLTHEKEKIEKQEEIEKEAIKQRVEADLQRKQQSYINEMRNQVLQEKQNLLSGIYNEAIEKLSNLSSADFIELVHGAIQQINSNDKTELVMGELSRNQLDQSGFNKLQTEFPQLSISNDVLKGEGGFILSQEGMDYNFTFNKLISEYKDTLASDLSRKAF